MNKVRIALLATALAFLGGFGQAQVVEAACGAIPGNCLSGPNPAGSSTAAVVVQHLYEGAEVDFNVEPDDTDTWKVTATHSTIAMGGGCSCNDYTSNVTADVTWTGSAWSVNCTGCSSLGPIVNVSVCDVASCTGAETHGWSYKLIATVAQTRVNQCLANAAHLTSVLFETTAIDDGDTISACREILAVSPKSQTYSGTDVAFDCSLACGGVSGPTIQIYYE